MNNQPWLITNNSCDFDPKEIIDGAIAAHNIDEIWAMFSGGHDSLVSTHIASSHEKFNGVLHIDTGIGIPQTQQYVIDVCDRFGWECNIYRAIENTKADGTPDPIFYRDLVLQWGFPGANLHQFMYSCLKERQIARFVRDRKKKGIKRIGLVSGVRTAESDRRNRKLMSGSQMHHRVGMKVWIAPIILFTEEDCQAYMKSHALPRNPVKDNLCMSGECLCGAFAQRNELTQLEVFYPEVAERIRKLEKEVYPSFPWGWEDQPPKWWKNKQKSERLEANGQLNLFTSPLCYSCAINHHTKLHED
jgi:3'-phosphoadenosine 5'-phosphosulfate sulfotransferase (PAPS reductase)/FAD synthetase